MKIKVIETITEIEATAQEINASQTVGGRFASLLANALVSCECSECGLYVQQPCNFCPNCGAKMEGEKP